ncbi:hypothetical protein DL96DRAFT_1504618 [Flagelloscypha sp. PMI_526]|nr:hypothetical protein DL96DRAFT_1504618 [Flagelloscypha sp. PMI_526]
MLLKRVFSLLVIAVSAVTSTAVARSDCVPGSEICASSTSTARRSLPIERAECEPGSELCGTLSTAVKRELSSVRPLAKRMTNAERLARGLPLNKPQARASRTRRSSPSDLPPTQHTGVIEVRRADNNNLLGYIGKDLISGAQSIYTESIADALQVSFELPFGATSGTPQIKNMNSNPDWPLLGLVQGRDNTDSNVNAGSFQYLYMGGVANPGTQPGDRPTSIDNSYSTVTGKPRTVETSVWTVDTITGSMTLTWVNESDGKPFNLQTWTQSIAVYAGGDQGAFGSRYPSPLTTVTYTFVPQ